MIHLLQSEYDELLAAQEALAILRGERVASAAAESPPRALVALQLARVVLDQAKAMGVHLTIERLMKPGGPSMGNIGYSIKSWPDQRRTTP